MPLFEVASAVRARRLKAGEINHIQSQSACAVWLVFVFGARRTRGRVEELVWNSDAQQHQILSARCRTTGP
jgi:hypothetical protein